MAEGGCRATDDEWLMANDECRVAEGELQVAGGELKMGDEQCDVGAGGCDEGQRSEPMTEGSSGPIVEHDSNRVIDDSTNDKIEILSHEGAPRGRPTGTGRWRRAVPPWRRNDAPKSAKQSQFEIEAKPGNART